MLSKQAYFGLIDNIEWVLKMTRDPSRSLEDLEHFFMVMIRDNLYTEHWLHWSKQVDSLNNTNLDFLLWINYLAEIELYFREIDGRSNT